jgi:LacI family transcriptional regulator
MATQSEVAKKAGVSFITVSRVINNKGNVREETRERVLEAIKELNYYPNSLGRGLNSNKVDTIGIMIATLIGVNIHSTQFYNELMSGIEGTCIFNSYDILISTQKKYPGVEYDYLKLYFERKIDGIIMVSPDISDLQLKQIESDKIPCVIINSRADNYRISYIDVDNRGAVNKVGDYLIQNGHRKIAFLKGIENNHNAEDRLAGFYDVIKKYNLDIPDSWILEGDFTVEGGRRAIHTLMAQDNPPTVLICANDQMALGVMAEAKNIGLKIPDDLSLIGFDGIEAHRYTTPILATMRQPLTEMGAIAAEILFEQLKDPNSYQEIRIFPVELVPGESVRNLYI